jgi:hypothetical protein
MTAEDAADLSTNSLKRLLSQVQSCPFDKDTFNTMHMNEAGGGHHILTRHAVSPAASRYHEFCDSRIEANAGDTQRERKCWEKLAQKAVGYVVGTLMASFIS